jgi:WD40 repeat protein
MFIILLESSIYSRGITGIGQNLLAVGKSKLSSTKINLFFCIGNHLGEILIFTIPQKGTNIFLKETIPGKNQNVISKKILILNLGHQFGITSLVSNSNLLISSDTSGVILIWNIRTMLQINLIQSIDESGITSLAIWNNCIAASYANGMIRFFDPENGKTRI